MASGLSMPVGYKNSTDGNLQIAIDALKAAATPHAFLGIDEDGRTSVVTTKGNPWGHIILRGGRSGANYDREHVRAAIEKLSSCGVKPNLMVDCSHANSGKDPRNQQKAWRSVIQQRAEGCRNLIGLMLESNLFEGNQSLGDDPSQLRHGVSITDACIGWDETEKLILDAHEALSDCSEK